MYSSDISSTLRLAMNVILSKVLPLVLYTDSKSLFYSLVGMKSTTEKRLLIDLFMLRESYELGKLTEVSWIPISQTLADASTKKNLSDNLYLLMSRNKIKIKPKSWIERTLN